MPAWRATSWKARCSAPARARRWALVKFRHPFLRPRLAGVSRRLRHARHRHRHRAQRAGLRRGGLRVLPAHGMRNDEILTPVQGDGVYIHRLPLLRRHVDLEGQSGHRREAAKSGRCFAEQDHAQLHALLAPQDADHLPRHHAVVRRHGSVCRPRKPATPCATRRWRRRGDRVLPRLGQGAAARDDRQPPRLVRFAPAQLGRADSVLPAQGNRRVASAHAGTAGRWRSASRRAASTPGSALDPAELLGDEAASTTRCATRWTSGSIPAPRTACAARLACGGASFPADLYLEGSDQHRGWFHSSLLTGCAPSTAVRPTRRC
jgi:isoleucyl-tRNA synthetase